MTVRSDLENNIIHAPSTEVICHGGENKLMVGLSKLSAVILCQFILFLVQVVTGGWIWFDILHGFRPPFALLRIHPISGIVLTIFILIHIYMNRKWIKVQLNQ